MIRRLSRDQLRTFDPRWGLLGLVASVVVIALLGYVVARGVGWVQPPVQRVPVSAPIPPRGWPSGVWTGGRWGADRVAAFGAWRGSPVDTAVTYPAYGTWGELTNDSSWHVEVFKGFGGKLVYGLPLLPTTGGGTLREVAAGRHDAAFVAVAKTLTDNRRGDSFIRIGLEANGDWFPWGAGYGTNTPKDFIAAYRHVAALLRKRLPQARLVFDVSCGAQLAGQTGRLDALTKLYPGDDVVDVIGCDVYDHYTTISHTEKQFRRVLRPDDAVGLDDLVDFATAHRKPFAVPEWGLTATDRHGGGDNPYFIYSMYTWFAAHQGRLAFENYFNEPEQYLRSAIWDQVDNPRAAVEYRRLYSRAASPSVTAPATPRSS